MEKLFKTSDEFGVGCTMSCKPTMSPERCEAEAAEVGDEARLG